MLTKDQMKAKADEFVKVKTVDIPNFGEVGIRTLSAAERGRFEILFAGNKKPPADIRERLVVLGLGDEKGGRIFDDNEQSVLSGWPASVVDRIFDEIRKFNGMGEDAIDEEEKD